MADNVTEEDNEMLSWLLYSSDSINLEDFGLANPEVDDLKYEVALSDLDEGEGSVDHHHSTEASKENNRKKRQREDALEQRLEDLQTGNTLAVLPSTPISSLPCRKLRTASSSTECHATHD